MSPNPLKYLKFEFRLRSSDQNPGQSVLTWIAGGSLLFVPQHIGRSRSKLNILVNSDYMNSCGVRFGCYGFFYGISHCCNMRMAVNLLGRKYGSDLLHMESQIYYIINLSTTKPTLSKFLCDFSMRQFPTLPFVIEF